MLRDDAFLLSEEYKQKIITFKLMEWLHRISVISVSFRKDWWFLLPSSIMTLGPDAY